MSNVLFKLTYGLFVLSVHCHERDNACIINTGIQVASNPNKIAISVNKANFTRDMLEYTDVFTLSIISEDAKFELFKRFGFCSGRDVEKFSGYENCITLKNGTKAITEGTNGYISAKVVERLDLGSHILFVAEITETGSFSSVPSIDYGFYQEHVKPKPQIKQVSGKTVWRCSVCGYEYVGDNLPDNFFCPTCKHGIDDFIKV